MTKFEVFIHMLITNGWYIVQQDATNGTDCILSTSTKLGKHYLNLRLTQAGLIRIHKRNIIIDGELDKDTLISLCVLGQQSKRTTNLLFKQIAPSDFMHFHKQFISNVFRTQCGKFLYKSRNLVMQQLDINITRYNIEL